MAQISTVLLLSISLFLTACGRNTPVATTQAMLPVNPTSLPQATMTATNTEISPTQTSTLLPPSQAQNASSEAGLIIFSMSDGEYKHLFAYHPSYLPITRLTSDAWDDDSPAVSPDGNQIVFTSNRFGAWDIFLLDLPSNSLVQLTKTNDYEGTLSFSPDGQWITYDVYHDNFFNIMIQSTNDFTIAPIQLTDGTVNNFSPAWSPLGDEIAFVTDRSGRNEIWVARTQNPDDRFSKIMGSSAADYNNPTWSPDGLTLAWSRTQTDSEIQSFEPQHPEISPITLGKGKSPVWLPDGSGVLATLKLANQVEFLAYAISDHHLILPPIPLSGSISTYDWKAGQLSENIKSYLSKTQITPPAALWVEIKSIPANETGRLGLVLLEGVEAPQPYLSDAADDNFKQLRTVTTKKLGWDLLAILDNASLALTSAPLPGDTQSWMYTGRSISLNLAPYEAGWMTVVREEFNGETYWRVWLKCQNQDGTCGNPLFSHAWDFKSRYSGDASAYEEGGKLSTIPSGYWVDFTELASRFGWERLPSKMNWRSYFQGILFNTFILRQGLTLEDALKELYPSEVVDTFLENK